MIPNKRLECLLVLSRISDIRRGDINMRRMVFTQRITASWEGRMSRQEFSSVDTHPSRDFARFFVPQTESGHISFAVDHSMSIFEKDTMMGHVLAEEPWIEIGCCVRIFGRLDVDGSSRNRVLGKKAHAEVFPGRGHR